MAFGFLGKKADKEINKVLLLPLDKIISNPNQPRKHFDQPALQELCRSIITSGLLQPVTVRRLENDTCELVAGERRVMAFRILGKTHIPAIVEEYTGDQAAVMALVENLQRKDLNYFEEAAGIAKLMQEQNLTQAQASQRIGKAQSTIANKLRLLKYPPELQERMLTADLTERHARALLRIPDELLEVVVQYVISNDLNVDQTERYINQLLGEKKESSKTRIFVVKDLRIFLNTINKAAELMRASGIPIDIAQTEDDDAIQYILKIPKAEAVKPGMPRAAKRF